MKPAATKPWANLSILEICYMHHPTDRIVQIKTSCVALAGIKNSSVGPTSETDPSKHAP